MRYYYFLKKSNHLRSQFIHFYIEELAESLIRFSIKERRSIKKKNLNLNVKWNYHTKGCSLNIMSTISVKQQNSQADILNPFYSGQIALIWKEIRFFFLWIKWLRFRTKEYIRDLNDNINIMRYYVRKSHFYYINKDSILKSLLIHAIWLALMDMMNIIRWINYEDLIRN